MAAARYEQNEDFFVKMFSDPDMMRQVMETVGTVLYERLRAVSYTHLHEDKQLQYYLDFPFEFHEQIVEFASSGIISKKEFSDYLDLREAFRTVSYTHLDVYKRQPSCSVTFSP